MEEPISTDGQRNINLENFQRPFEVSSFEFPVCCHDVVSDVFQGWSEGFKSAVNSSQVFRFDFLRGETGEVQCLRFEFETETESNFPEEPSEGVGSIEDLVNIKRGFERIFFFGNFLDGLENEGECQGFE